MSIIEFSVFALETKKFCLDLFKPALVCFSQDVEDYLLIVFKKYLANYKYMYQFTLKTILSRSTDTLKDWTAGNAYIGT